MNTRAFSEDSRCTVCQRHAPRFCANAGSVPTEIREGGTMSILKVNLAIAASVLIVLIFLVGPLGASSPDNKPMSLVKASAEGDLGAVEKLVAEGVDVNSEVNEVTALYLVCTYGVSHYNVFRASDGTPARMIIKDDSGPALGSVKARTKIAELLLSKGAKVAIKTDKGRTPLMEACQSGWTPLAKLLIAKGADVNGTDHKGRTPLMECIKGPTLSDNEFAMFSMFADSGLKSRQIPVPYEDERLELIDFIIGKGADVSAKDNAGTTVLIMACGTGRAPFVKALLTGNSGGLKGLIRGLLSSGGKLDLNAKDSTGKTALGYAKEKCNTEIIGLLRERGGLE
jgi:uncharacterized protein